MTTWSIEPLISVTVPKAAIVHLFEDMDILRRMFFIIFILALIYPTVHQTLMFVDGYKQIDSSRKVVVLHHAVESLILIVASPLYTYVMIQINFVLGSEHFQDHFTAAAMLCFALMSMYLIELASRFQNRAILIFHHVLAVSSGLLFLLFPTPTMMKT